MNVNIKVFGGESNAVLLEHGDVGGSDNEEAKTGVLLLEPGNHFIKFDILEYEDMKICPKVIKGTLIHVLDYYEHKPEITYNEGDEVDPFIGNRDQVWHLKCEKTVVLHLMYRWNYH